MDGVGAVGEVGVDLEPGGVGRHGRGIVELAVVAEGQAVLQRVVPNEAGRGIGQRIVAEGVAADEAAEGLSRGGRCCCLRCTRNGHRPN